MPIYLDYNATAPLRPVARTAMNATLDLGPTNASSIHGYGRAARKMIEEARAHVAALVGATASQVIFNSGATEGNNTVLDFYTGSPSLTLPLTGGGKSTVLISATSHASIIEAGKVIGAEIIPVTQDGTVDIAALESMVAAGPPPALISVVLVNNETGVIQPVDNIVRIARQVGAAVHLDAVQAVGKIPVDMRTLGVDVMTITAHKIGGPQGVGAIILADANTGACRPPPVWLRGGGQERSLRPGTENVAGIAGFGAAAEDVFREGDLSRLHQYRTQIEKHVKTVRQGTVIFGDTVSRVANTVCFSVPGTEAQTLLIQLDLAGIAVSSGSACSSGKVRPSHVLSAMGVAPELARGALRVSMGWGTTRDDVEQFMAVWHKIISQ